VKMATSHRPLITAVMPYVQSVAAIESVPAQTYPHLEIIVVDGGSGDGSGQTIQRFISERTSESRKVLFLTQPNQGARDWIPGLR